MATFNTVDELIRILDEDPQLREALRARLLPQELLDLPAAHAAFVAGMEEFRTETQTFIAGMEEFRTETQTFIAGMEEFRTETQAFIAGMEEFRTETQAFIAGMEEFRTETQAFIAGMEEFRVETKAFIAEVREFVSATNQRMDSLELRIDRGFSRLNNDIGILRGNYAENAVRRQAITIAFGVGNANGFNFDETTLKPLDRDALVRKAANSGLIADIPQNERASFYVSDFIAEVCDEAGETHYIVVEASYTCDKRDTDRVISHAKLMTRFTQKRAWPVIAGARMDDEIQHIVEAGDVLWFRFEQDEFRSDY